MPGQSENYVALLGFSEGVMTWSTLVEGEVTIGGVPAVPALEGGVVFASIGDEGSQLVRHAADGSRVATLALSAAPHDLAADGSGRIIYAGIFEAGDVDEAAYVELDQSLAPLGPQRALPWELGSLSQYRVAIAAAPDGTTIAAGGDFRGTGRWLSKLDADGNEVWTSPWPVASEPDAYGSGSVAGVAVLADGTVGLALTSGDLYDGDLWLEAFHPDGQPAWAATAPGRKTIGVAAHDDAFVVSSEERLDAYAVDGAEAWSFEAELRGHAKPCTDAELVAATATGFVRFPLGGTPVAQDVELLELVLPMLEPFDEAGSLVHDVVCTPDGEVIVVADIDVTTPPSGDCESEG